MDRQLKPMGLAPKWWALILAVVVAAFTVASTAAFNGSFRSVVPVTLTSDRAGLVMEADAQVKLRGVEVGRVSAISTAGGNASLKLEIDRTQLHYIPANVGAQIKATTAFGAKYVDLTYPEQPSAARLSADQVLVSSNVTTEVNTVFQNLMGVLDQIDPAKLNSVLTAVADALRGKGPALGQAITDTDNILTALNARTDTIRQDLRAATALSDAYSNAAPDILRILDAAATTSTTLTSHASALDALLLNGIGLARSGEELLGPTQGDFVHSINLLEPTTRLLMKYNPEYTCLLLGVKWTYDHGLAGGGANGATAIVDASFINGDDPYAYPDNLPIVAAKGGPGGTPGCGSLPDVTKKYPVRELVTNTGWGTGIDIRPNPGIGHPCWADYLPVTRAVPEPPSIRACLPGPAPGPIPYPGAPPYGAPLYGPDGAALYPPAPGAPTPPEPTPAVQPMSPAPTP
jgi:phospholipid/cholesterol/gamma-HCH transport system substrate-binding protein